MARSDAAPAPSLIVAAARCGAWRCSSCRREPRARRPPSGWFALGASLAEFAATLVAVVPLRSGAAPTSRWSSASPGSRRSASSTPWASTASACFLVVLTGFLTPLALLAVLAVGAQEGQGVLAPSCSLLESAMIGVFLSLDLFLFYVFWDAMLIPMYFLIGVWGDERRIYAAVKFILYTMAGSVLMLVAILGLAVLHSDVDRAPTASTYEACSRCSSRRAPQTLALPGVRPRLRDQGAAVPVPHVAARRARRGADRRLGDPGRRAAEDGHLRPAALRVPAVPGRRRARSRPCIAVLAVIGIVYGALVAMVQPDLKKLVAYSSVSHLGFVVLGICAMNVQGVQGAVYQMLNHGVSTGALFLIVGMLSERRHTRLIAEFGGLKNVMPRLVGRVPGRHAVVDRPAGPERLRRRVPDPARRVPVEPVVGGRRRDRRDPLGRLHAVDVPARELRRRDEPEERGPEGPERARVVRCSCPPVVMAVVHGRGAVGVPEPDEAGRRAHRVARWPRPGRPGWCAAHRRRSGQAPSRASGRHGGAMRGGRRCASCPSSARP